MVTLSTSKRKSSKKQPSAVTVLVTAGIICGTIFGFTIANLLSTNSTTNLSDSILTSVGEVKIDSDRGKKRSLSPFFSIKPLPYSLHPKYKLWTEMTPMEQESALDFVGKFMRKYAAIIKPEGVDLQKLSSVKQGTCEFDKGIGSTGHTICGPKPEGPCHFISFGINDDPSWDREMATQWGCRGYAGDPTVHHPSKLHDKVTFHNIGATVLQDNEERLINKGGAEEWWMTSFPKLRYFLGLEKIDVLKIDCEGCEVALSRDMLREDPEFLFKVDQISIETHVTKTWMSTDRKSVV